jgi:hypothetical protein
MDGQTRNPFKTPGHMPSTQVRIWLLWQSLLATLARKRVRKQQQDSNSNITWENHVSETNAINGSQHGGANERDTHKMYCNALWRRRRGDAARKDDLRRLCALTKCLDTALPCSTTGENSVVGVNAHFRMELQSVESGICQTGRDFHYFMQSRGGARQSLFTSGLLQLGTEMRCIKQRERSQAVFKPLF